MNDVLYHKSMALFSLPYEKVRLRNTSADGYLYQVIADTEADWVINIDEDAFISNIDALQRLIGYCMENGYVNCGMPDGGVVHLRDGNPLVTNPYLNILHTKAIREQFDISKLNESTNQARFTQTDLLVGAHDFSATNVEPYYPLFIWMSNHFKTLYLKATNHPDGESTVLYNHLGEEVLIHTWYSRFYNRVPFHTRRINNAFKEACGKQGIRYHNPLRDTLTCVTARTNSLIQRSLVSAKRIIVKR
jgi:hypothetical protein